MSRYGRVLSERGRDAVVDVFRQLRQHGTLGTGDLQETVYPDYEDHWAGPRAMWNAIDCYLEDIPGLEKAGYGEWGHTTDDDVRSTIEEEWPFPSAASVAATPHPDFARVFGDRDDEVHGCPACRTYAELKDGTGAGARGAPEP